MTWARQFALPLIVIATVGASSVSLAGQRAFEGAYIASGVDAAGNEYRRAVDIEQDGERFTVVWVSARFVDGALVLEPTWIGVGMADGDTLSVSFIADDVLGIIVYRFAPDGRQLTGRWTLEDDDTIYSETLTPLLDVLPTPTEGDPSEEQRPRPLSAAAPAVVSL